MLKQSSRGVWKVKKKLSRGKKLILKISQKLPKSLQLSLKEAPTQMFSCKFCEIFKDAYFEEHLRTAAFKYGTMKRMKPAFLRLLVFIINPNLRNIRKAPLLKHLIHLSILFTRNFFSQLFLLIGHLLSFFERIPH